MSDDSPAPAPTFDSMALSEPVRRAIDEFGFTHPTPVQRAAFEPAAAGHDLIVQSRTGTGKTLAFGLPLVDRIVEEGRGLSALILAPTRELALQSQRAIEQVAKYKQLRTVAVYGGAPMERQVTQLKQGAEIVSGTPGRVLDHIRRGTLDPSGISVLVLDEADEMFSMGFAKELNAIMDALPADRQFLCFSATIDDNVQRIAERRMKNPQFITLSSDQIGAAEISHYFYMVLGDKLGALVRVLEVEDPESAIIFCNTKSETETVARHLSAAGFNADWLNGDLPQRDREQIMKRTREGQLRYMVATDVAARGIDISHLTHVINFGFPESAEQYVHRTGRTGRAGRTGTAISVLGPGNLGALYYLRLTYKIFPIECSIPSETELKTRRETDRLSLLVEAFKHGAFDEHLELVRRLKTHPDADRVLSGMVRSFFSTLSGDVDESAAAARRERTVAAPEFAHGAASPAHAAEARPRAREQNVEARPRAREQNVEARPRVREQNEVARTSGRGEVSLASEGEAGEAEEAGGVEVIQASPGTSSKRRRRRNRGRDGQLDDGASAVQAGVDDGGLDEPEPAETPQRGAAVYPVKGGEAQARAPRAVEAQPQMREPNVEARPRTRAQTIEAFADTDPREPSGAEQAEEIEVPEARPELPDMTTLYLNVGKRDGLEANDLAALLATACELGSDDIGRVRVKDRHTFVGVPTERVEFVISSLTGHTIKNRALHVERART
jgi:ATP-dependent RNA helicase DeaD